MNFTKVLLYCVIYWSGWDKLGLALRSHDELSKDLVRADEP